jgi:hypothetical protein
MFITGANAIAICKNLAEAFLKPEDPAAPIPVADSAGFSDCCGSSSLDGKRRHYYYRDHEQSGAWGVREFDGATGRIVAIGMDKTDALMLALFLDGQFAEAEAIQGERR